MRLAPRTSARGDSARLRASGSRGSRGARDSAFATLDFGLARFLAAVVFAAAWRGDPAFGLDSVSRARSRSSFRARGFFLGLEGVDIKTFFGECTNGRRERAQNLIVMRFSGFCHCPMGDLPHGRYLFNCHCCSHCSNHCCHCRTRCESGHEESRRFIRARHPPTGR